ncbi:MAG: hypothetical protein A2265_05360 [Bacteroidetes bacterium RIFOXYA12_FULL_33_9]|nr:MAG: hypothetical protein A2265_05360 [Bacteroidetes bacterium RIFOXYA12_FULL_33_9]
MSNNYLCPHCKGYLNVDDKIIFGVRSKHNKKGLLLLSSKIGDYSIHSHPEFKYEKGDLISFYCPICNESLHTPSINNNLAKIEMIDEIDNHLDIYFSGVVGEKCTYVIKDKDIEAYGDNKSNYLDFFNLSSIR